MGSLRPAFSFLCCGLLLAAACAVSCASADVPAPQWMSALHEAYPDSKFIAQKGSGSTADSAKADALAALGRYLYVSVDSRLSTSLSAAYDGKDYSEVRQVQDEISVDSSAELLGAQLSECYYSRAEKSYFCAAFIEREYAWKQFCPKIESEKKAFYEFYDEAQELAEDEPFLAARNFERAQVQGDKFLSALDYGRIISERRERAYASDRDDVASVGRKLSEAKEGCALFLEASGDHEQIVAGEIRKAFSEAGYVLSDDEENALYVIRAAVSQNLTAEDEGGGSALYSCLPSVELSVVSKGSQRAVFGFNARASKRSAAYSKENALKKALSLLAQEMEPRLAAQLRPEGASGSDIR